MKFKKISKNSEVLDIAKGVVKMAISIIAATAIVLAPAFAIFSSMTDCKTKEENAENNVAWQEKEIAKEVFIYTDPDTKVEYLIYKPETAGSSITPRLNPNGTPYLNK